MKFNYTSCISLFLSLVLTVSCAKTKKSEAAIERENWLLSLNDSIADYQSRIAEAEQALTSIHNEIGEMIVNFDHVSNPKLVEGYYIYKGWSAKYPLTGTGIVARITQDEGFELIAALSGGRFNRIRVTSGGSSAESNVVPHDQALNYRTETLNTVCFFGSAADSIGQLISGNNGGTVTVEYLGDGKPGKHQLSPEEVKMIGATWKLFSSQRASHRLEREIPMLSRRIDVCRRMIEMNNSEADDSENETNES